WNSDLLGSVITAFLHPNMAASLSDELPTCTLECRDNFWIVERRGSSSNDDFFELHSRFRRKIFVDWFEVEVDGFPDILHRLVTRVPFADAPWQRRYVDGVPALVARLKHDF